MAKDFAADEGALDDVGNNGCGEGPRSDGGSRRGRGARTRESILFAAGRHFARNGFSGVTLRDIADDVGVTPAMILRYFGSKRALFEAVAHIEPNPGTRPEELQVLPERALAMIRYWQDPDLRTPALAMVRSLELDGGALFAEELHRRVTEPWSALLTGEDADVRLRLGLSLSMGVGLFGLGTLLNPDQSPLPDEEIRRMAPYLARMLAVLLTPDNPGPGET